MREISFTPESAESLALELQGKTSAGMRAYLDTLSFNTCYPLFHGDKFIGLACVEFGSHENGFWISSPRVQSILLRKLPL